MESKSAVKNGHGESREDSHSAQQFFELGGELLCSLSAEVRDHFVGRMAVEMADHRAVGVAKRCTHESGDVAPTAATDNPVGVLGGDTP